jgi:hypothetical protein
MKKYCLLVALLLIMQSCSFAATPTPTAIPTPIPTPTIVPPTPVGYGVDFPFNLDPVKEWGENVTVTCEQNHDKGALDPDTVRKLVASGGKLETTKGENANLTYLWAGNVPLELFIEPEDNGTGFGIYYDYWQTSYCVHGLPEDVNGWGAYIFVITKIQQQQ